MHIQVICKHFILKVRVRFLIHSFLVGWGFYVKSLELSRLSWFFFALIFDVNKAFSIIQTAECVADCGISTFWPCIRRLSFAIASFITQHGSRSNTPKLPCSCLLGWLIYIRQAAVMPHLTTTQRKTLNPNTSEFLTGLPFSQSLWVKGNLNVRKIHHVPNYSFKQPRQLPRLCCSWQ